MSIVDEYSDATNRYLPISIDVSLQKVCIAVTSYYNYDSHNKIFNVWKQTT